jgi:septal ring-binding cell division protein DamX
MAFAPVSHLHLLCLTLLISAAQSAAAAKETCVPNTEGGWRCGREISKADAAPLPKTERTSRPPLLLIDPRRFSTNPNVSAAAAPVPNAVDSPTEVSAASTVSAPLQPTSAAGVDEAAAASGAFTVQLARAQSNSGFLPLQQRLGLRDSDVRKVQLQNGDWLFLFGQFDSLAAARAAIPKGATGAFARPAIAP